MSKMTNKYSFEIAWSDEDNAYIACCPEFPGLIAHGDTPEEAVIELRITIEDTIDIYKNNNLTLPEPRLFQLKKGTAE